MTERDNESRLGIAPTEEISTPTPQTSQITENKVALDFVMPTELVDLPSQGKFYPDGHPLKGQKTIELKYMTAKEEDILTSKTLLKKGIAIDKMLESLIVDKKIKLDDLNVTDKNALILAARKTGYGPLYSTTVSCPACEKKVKFEFNLEEIRNKESQNVDGVIATEKGTFLLTLPRMKVEVELKPITGRDERALAELQEQKKTQDGTATSQIKMATVSVNGDTNKRVIDSFVQKMPASDAKYLRDSYKKLIPDVDMRQTFTCKECDHEEVIEVPLTTDFFWPK